MVTFTDEIDDDRPYGQPTVSTLVALTRPLEASRSTELFEVAQGFDTVAATDLMAEYAIELAWALSRTSFPSTTAMLYS